jgi:hypothetical protein
MDARFRFASSFSIILLFISAPAIAADVSTVPAKSLAVKKELLFSDDFENAQPAKQWHDVVPTFTFEKGMLKGTQTRDKRIPASEGQKAVTAHAAVYGLDIPTKDSVVEVKIRFDGANMMDVEFDDRAYTGSHYGHICRALAYLDKVTILDERDGTQSNEVNELKKDAEKNKDAIRKLVADHTATFPLATKLEPGKWYTYVVETVGDEMRVTIDGQPVAYFKSSGIGHATKSKIELGVGGKDGYFDDIKVWNAEPTKP